MGDDMDDEFLQELREGFCSECIDSLDASEGLLLSYESDPNPETINAFKRQMHGMKGSSRAVGLANFSSYVHAMETYCTRLESGDGEVDFLFKCLDHLKACNELSTQGKHAEAEAIMEKELAAFPS